MKLLFIFFIFILSIPTKDIDKLIILDICTIKYSQKYEPVHSNKTTPII